MIETKTPFLLLGAGVLPGALIKTKAEIYMYHLKDFTVNDDEDLFFHNTKLLESKRVLTQPGTVLLLLKAVELESQQKFLKDYRIFCLLEDKVVTTVIGINVSKLEQNSIEFL